MSLATLFLIIAGVILIIVFFKKPIEDFFKSIKQKEQENAEEKAKQKTREDEGFITTSLRVIFGDKAIDEGIKDGKVFTTTKTSTPEQLSRAFSDSTGRSIIFDKSAKVDPKTGIIISDKAPTFIPNQKDIDDINKARIKAGLKPLNITEEENRALIFSKKPMIQVQKKRTFFHGGKEFEF